MLASQDQAVSINAIGETMNHIENGIINCASTGDELKESMSRFKVDISK